MKKNIAVIGCGHWGKNLVRNFYELGCLAAVCDPNKSVAEKYASKYKVKNYTFSQINNEESIEGIVLAVPAPLHASMAIEAMNAKKHVYVEKPLAMDKLQAQEMIDIASKNGVHLMVGHLLQYHSVFTTIRKLVESDDFGDLRYIYSNRLSFGKVRSEEDVIWSFAPHDISMILALSGDEPEIVKAEISKILQPEIADIATIHMEFKSNLKAHISVSWLHPYKEQKLVVIGESLMAVFDDGMPWSEKLSLYPHSAKNKGGLINLEKAEVEYMDLPQTEPLKNECQHFLDVVSRDIKPLTDGREGLKVLNVLSAASLSATRNEMIRLDSL